jgi:hypothetical protein
LDWIYIYILNQVTIGFDIDKDPDVTWFGVLCGFCVCTRLLLTNRSHLPLLYVLGVPVLKVRQRAFDPALLQRQVVGSRNNRRMPQRQHRVALLWWRVVGLSLGLLLFAMPQHQAPELVAVHDAVALVVTTPPVRRHPLDLVRRDAGYPAALEGRSQLLRVDGPVAVGVDGREDLVGERIRFRDGLSRTRSGSLYTTGQDRTRIGQDKRRTKTREGQRKTG